MDGVEDGVGGAAALEPARGEEVGRFAQPHLAEHGKEAAAVVEAGKADRGEGVRGLENRATQLATQYPFIFYKKRMEI